MDLIKSGKYNDIFYAKICATTKISTVAGYHVVPAMLLFFFVSFFLAHLSRRLTRWAYSIPMVRRRPSSSSVGVHTFKLEYLWSQLANLDQILRVALLGWGKGCIRFWGRLDQNSGFHGNRNPPLAYNGENDVSTFSRLFMIQSFLYLQVTRTCIKSPMGLNFGQVERLSCPWASKKFPIYL